MKKNMCKLLETQSYLRCCQTLYGFEQFFSKKNNKKSFLKKVHPGIQIDNSDLIKFYTPFFPNTLILTVLRQKITFPINFSLILGNKFNFLSNFPQFQMLQGKVKLAKVDCDQFPGVCQTAYVRAYPTVKLYLGSHKAGVRQDANGILIQSQHPETIVRQVEQTIRQHKSRFDDEL